jgi:hypothetical protein
MNDLFPLRVPCRHCSGTSGLISQVNGQAVVRCSDCRRFQYNAPKTETGAKPRTVAGTHNGIKPSTRIRIIERATGRCELCGSRENLHVGHILSVLDATAAGLSDYEINSDDNLAAMCEACNLGLSSLSISPRLYVALFRRRLP